MAPFLAHVLHPDLQSICLFCFVWHYDILGAGIQVIEINKIIIITNLIKHLLDSRHCVDLISFPQYSYEETEETGTLRV